MIDVSVLNDPDFLITVFFVFSYGLVSWFMGWGISFLTSLFIKVFNKA